MEETDGAVFRSEVSTVIGWKSVGIELQIGHSQKGGDRHVRTKSFHTMKFAGIPGERAFAGEIGRYPANRERRFI